MSRREKERKKKLGRRIDYKLSKVYMGKKPIQPVGVNLLQDFYYIPDRPVFDYGEELLLVIFSTKQKALRHIRKLGVGDASVELLPNEVFFDKVLDILENDSPDGFMVDPVWNDGENGWRMSHLGRGTLRDAVDMLVSKYGSVDN